MIDVQHDVSLIRTLIGVIKKWCLPDQLKPAKNKSLNFSSIPMDKFTSSGKQSLEFLCSKLRGSLNAFVEPTNNNVVRKGICALKTADFVPVDAMHPLPAKISSRQHKI